MKKYKVFYKEEEVSEFETEIEAFKYVFDTLINDRKLDVSDFSIYKALTK